MALICGERITKTYRVGEVDVPAIRGVDFTIEAGAFVAFVGPSGSGKSTLLNLVGCLDHPSAGRLTVLDVDVAGLSRNAAAAFRGEHLGFVFQDFNLVPVLSAYENIEYSLAPELVYTGVTNLELRARAVFLRGDRHTDFCEKPNRLRFEVYARLYF